MNVESAKATASETARMVVEFLEVAVTSILFLKGLYPSGAYGRWRYMNLLVHKAIHPGLSNYIHSSVNGLFPFIEKGLVEKVAIIFYGDNNIPLEKFVFKLRVSQLHKTEVEVDKLESSLRSLLVKLSVSDMCAKVLQSDCRWEITAYCPAPPDADTIKDPQFWRTTQTKQWCQPPVITPIKSVSSEPLALQLYVEHPTESEI